MSSFSLKNKNILITGVSGVLGKNLAKEIKNDGGTVIGVDKVTSDLDLFIKVDFSNRNEIKEIPKYLESKKIKIDGLVLCHQAKPKGFLDKDIESFPEDLWLEIINTNLNATFFIIQDLLDSKISDSLDSIVLCGSTYANVSSNPNLYDGNEMGNPVAYSASKGGVVSLSRYLAVYLAEKNIRVNCISPHGINNEQSEDFLRRFSTLSPMSRLSNPEETSYPIIFLLSDASTYITGSNLIVDGGWTSW